MPAANMLQCGCCRLASLTGSGLPPERTKLFNPYSFVLNTTAPLATLNLKWDHAVVAARWHGCTTRHRPPYCTN